MDVAERQYAAALGVELLPAAVRGGGRLGAALSGARGCERRKRARGAVNGAWRLCGQASGGKLQNLWAPARQRP